MPDLRWCRDSSQHLLPLSRSALTLIVLGAACASEPRESRTMQHEAEGASAPISAGVASGLPGVALGDDWLSARAFAAEASFLFPSETRALAHALLRSEFARREAERLACTVDRAAVEAALVRTVADLEQQTQGDLEGWARDRYGQPWSRVRAGLAQRLADNQLYQQVARSWTLGEGQARLRMLSTREEETARDWVRRIGAGASAAKLAEASLDPGPQGDGTLPWLPQRLPPMQLDELGQAQGFWDGEPVWQVGAVIGPFRLAGESVWRLVEVLELRPAQALLPPRAELLAGLAENPISPLEERAWFAAMLDRYNAREGLPAFETPSEVFVRARSR